MTTNKMTKQKAISILQSFQDPEPWDPQITSDAFHALEMAIEALQFAQWVAEIIFCGDMDNAFTEIACRKLAKLGLVKSTGDEWMLEQENE